MPIHLPRPSHQPRRWIAIAGAVLAAAGCTPDATQPNAAGRESTPSELRRSFTFQALVLPTSSVPGVFQSQATGINARGQVIGSITIAPQDRAVLWEDGTMTVLPLLLPDDNLSAASAINARGQIAGISGFLEEHPQFVISRSHAVIWQDGQVTALPNLPGGQAGFPHGINSAGQVVGECPLPPVSPNLPTPVHACLWDHGQVTDLGTLGGTARALAINDQGDVAGYSFTAAAGGSIRAFLWHAGHLQDLGTLGGETSQATGIDERGVIVGSAQLPSGVTHAVRWLGGAITDLGTQAPEAVSYASAINAAGQIVGGIDGHAALWDHDTTIIVEPAIQSFPAAINQRGQIVGSALIDGRPTAVLWAASP
jgi:probable HAF family extracellular repeat protein